MHVHWSAWTTDPAANPYPNQFALALAVLFAAYVVWSHAKPAGHRLLRGYAALGALTAAASVLVQSLAPELLGVQQAYSIAVKAALFAAASLVFEVIGSSRTTDAESI